MTNEEGGSTSGPASSLQGTEAQVEWAGRIKRNVNEEFDRVAASFRSLADGQTHQKRAETEAVIAILEDKRAEVMSIQRAGYFIKFWQEITDQVRQMIFHDPRYQEIKGKREGRR
jgi:hypothetical protein